LAPGADQKELFYRQTEKTLSLVPEIRLEKDFGEGLYLYQYKPEKPFSLYETLDSYYKAPDSVFKEAEDPMYSLLGNYVNEGEDLFPYVGVTAYNESVKNGYIVSDSDKIIFKLPVEVVGDLYFDNEAYVYYDLLADRNGNKLSLKVVDSLDTGRIIGSTEIADFESYKVLGVGDDLFYFDPKAVSGNIMSLGHSFINPSSGTVINAYKDKYKSGEVQFNYSVLETCSEVEKNASYELDRFSGGFTLTGKNVRACVTVGLEKLLGDVAADVSDAVKISFDSDSKIPGKDVCVFNHSTGLCENAILNDGENYFILKAPPTDYSLRFYADARGSDMPVSATFRNLAAYPLVKASSFTLQPGDFSTKNSAPAEDIIFNKTKGLGGTVSQILSDPRPCNAEYDEKDYSIVKSGDSVIYKSSNLKSVCDSFWFPNVSHNSGLVLEVESKNISGSPLRMCLTNEFSKRCDIYEELPGSREKTKSFYLVPPMGPGFGYTVNFSNITFGDETSSNELSYLSLTRIPYDYIKSLHRDPGNSLVNDKKLLVYNQAYEKGWIALCGYKICRAKHVIVNNWSNGWFFDKSFDVSQVRVVFWPQLLEYLGMILCAGSFILVCICTNNKTL
jgi:hypothetical protein